MDGLREADSDASLVAAQSECHNQEFDDAEVPQDIVTSPTTNDLVSETARTLSEHISIAIPQTTSISPHTSLSSEEQDRTITLQRFKQPVGSVAHLPWHQHPAVKIKLSSLPPSIDAEGVWQLFNRHGNIEKIEIVHRQDSQQPNAFIIFKPPPKNCFWLNGHVTIPWKKKIWRANACFMPESYVWMYEAASSRSSYPERMTLEAETLEFGILCSPTSMKTFHTTSATSDLPISLHLNFRHSRLEVEFPQRLEISSTTQSAFSAGLDWQYRFIIPFAMQLKLFEVKDTNNEPQSTSLIICMDSPPEYSRKYATKDSHQPGSLRWDAAIDPWYRIIDLCERGGQISQQPASLHDSTIKHKIGRWTTYKIIFNKSVLESKTAKQFFDALEDHNLKIHKVSSFEMVAKDVQSVFDLLDSHPAAEEDQSSDFVKAFGDYNKISLDFQVRYQLEVCISEGLLSEYHIGPLFLQKLKKMDPDRARGLLIGVAAEKKRLFDPLDIFNSVMIKPDKLQLPSYCFYARSVTVTPTTMYVATPSLDVSNRVIRRYREHTDRFLRVRFTEERPRGKLRSTSGQNLNRLYLRVKNVLMNGIVIGDRHYQFLAFGNSQLREHTAYFFCSTGHLNPEKIRAWMGVFDDKVVAKYSARLGQCFSTTRAIGGAKIRLGKLEDVKTTDQKHVFTDGVGVISEFMAKIAASELGVLTGDGRSPSALQFRLGGCKGVLAVWPSQQRELTDIWVRRSQEKFQAEYQGLEIIRWSHFSSAYLNRQLITILTTLGVKDEVFLKKLESQLSQLEEAMVNPTMASRLLQRDIDPNQISLEVAAMVNCHFQLSQEPFMLSILQLWKAYTIKYLKEKARILIHEGANLLGVVDELGLLKGHYDKDQVQVREHHDVDSLPEIFVQLSNIDGIEGENKLKVIEGVVLLARNPSLHPGDIRVVRAVDVPRLHHLRDVVVLPKTGDRDLASMCSGGDLDGDDYLVIWDQTLVPRDWNLEPMDFTPPPPLEVEHSVTIDDMTSFFVQYIKNDALGSIAHAHLSWADQSTNGAKNTKCTELANLHSIAVDYPKSGLPAVMAPHLRSKVHPHFMEKPGRSYHSSTALGKLYDKIQCVDFMPDYEKPFDSRILNACKANEETLHKVAIIKADYDEGVRRIMAQHGIQWELEVWSTLVLYHNGLSNDYKFHEEIGRLSSSLKEAVRNICYEQAGGREYEKIAPFVAAMYKLTSLQVQDALEKITLRPIPKGTSLPFISFPWIFSSILGDIATGRIIADYGIVDKDVTDSLEKTQPETTTETESRPVKKIDHAFKIDDFVETGDGGTTHRGELLSLFDHPGAEMDKLDKVEDLISLRKIDANQISGSSSQHSEAVSEKVAIESQSDEGLSDSGTPEDDSSPAETRLGGTMDGSLSLLERLAQMHSD